MNSKAPSVAMDGKQTLDPFVPELYDPHSRDGLKHGLSWWLIGIGRLWRNMLDEKLKAEGQTQPRWRVLAWATMLPGITQSDLAERMDIARPTVVRILDSLEQQGMIERRPNLRDRRSNGIYLTAKARPVVSRIEVYVRQVEDQLLQDVSDEEMAMCLDVLRRIRVRVTEQGSDIKGFP